MSADGKLFVTASVDKTVKVWSGFDGMQMGEDLVHDDSVATVVLSPNGKLLAAGCINGQLVVGTLQEFPMRLPKEPRDSKVSTHTAS